MKYIKTYNRINESLIKDLGAGIDELKQLEVQLDEIEKRKDKLRVELGSKYTNQVVNSIYKCLNIIINLYKDDYDDYGLDEQVLGDELDIYQDLWKSFGFRFFLVSNNKGEFVLYNNDTEHHIPLSKIDIFRLYEVLKILISVPEVSWEMNKGAYVNMNK